jgi:uncharacterized protein YodC (DUF2158 family)
MGFGIRRAEPLTVLLSLPTMANKDIKPGQAVKLFIGGPTMVVSMIEKSPGTSGLCVWFDDDDRLQEGWFEMEWLRPAGKERKKTKS